MDEQSLSPNSLPWVLASVVCEAFERFQRSFTEITGRARTRFEGRDLRGAHDDAAERIELYDHCAARVASELVAVMADQYRDKRIWMKAKEAYTEIIEIRLGESISL